MERLRFHCDRGFANGDVIGISAVLRRVSHGEDFVALFESRHTLVNFFHHPRHIPTGDQRKFMLDDFFELTGAHFAVERVHASGMNPDEHFAFPYFWTWRIFVLQDFRSAVIVNSDCLHKF